MRHLLFVALLLGAGMAEAAPLCRDSKGLFTPCPPETPRQRERRTRAVAAAPARGGPASATAEVGARPAKPKKAPIVRRAKLCRDSKGLFTPCA